MINESWIPLITEGVSWVREILGPSKKELKLRIEDLENQLQKLSAGNAQHSENLQLILMAILRELKDDRSYEIHANNIVYVGTNSGTVAVDKSEVLEISDSIVSNNQVAEFDISRIFDGLDEQIAHARLHLPSDKEG